MTKAEFIDKVGEGTNGVSKKDVAEIINTTFSVLKAVIKDSEKFILPDFGTFTVRNRKARKGRNPQTGEEIMIKASKTIGFKPASKFKGLLK